MAGAVRAGVDSAGGIVLSGSPNVFINGAQAGRVGDAVQGHGNGEHAGPTLATGSPNVFVNGIPLCRAGDSATCGHVASGSPDVLSG